MHPDTRSTIDYLVVGHICYDLTPDGQAVGGAAAYAGCTAQVLNHTTAVLTSSADEPWAQILPQLAIHRVPAPATTTFENVYTASGRRQTIHAVAARLRASDVPPAWRQAPVVHLAPVANELAPDLVQQFPDSLIGVTPQGWLRGWDADGHVYAREWPDAAAVLPRATAVILSHEDLPDPALLTQYRRWSRLLVVTQGAAGCTLLMGRETHHVPAPQVESVEPTGAGDIFAAAFLTHLHTGKDPLEAARFANRVAAASTTVATLPAKIEKIRRLHVEASQ